MFFIPPDTFSTTIFLIIMVGVLITFFSSFFLANKKTGKNPWLPTTLLIAITLAWLGLIAAVVQMGFVKDHPMPGLPIFFVGILLVSAAVALSPVGARLANGTTISALVAFQLFRVPLEWVLHSWVEQGAIPPSMTWDGQNWDIFSGFMALAFITIVRRNPRLAWIPNVVGFILLLNVMRVAVMSSPIFFAWTVTPPLQLAFYLPYAFIIPIAVGGAVMGHIILTRALLKKPLR